MCPKTQREQEGTWAPEPLPLTRGSCGASVGPSTDPTWSPPSLLTIQAEPENKAPERATGLDGFQALTVVFLLP